MNVCGLAKRIFSPPQHHSPTRDSQSCSLSATLFRSAKRSITKKPKLCRVPSYSSPELPRPTISFIDQSPSTGRITSIRIRLPSVPPAPQAQLPLPRLGQRRLESALLQPSAVRLRLTVDWIRIAR